MRIDISFDAGQILNGTSLRHDFPDVWARYLDRQVVRFGQRTGARIYTQLGRHDLSIIRDYLALWLNHQELIPSDLRDRDARVLMAQAAQAIAALTSAISLHDDAATRQAELGVDTTS